VPVVEIAIILFLILLNGFFAMSELAVVSARRSRLEQMSKDGRRGAAAALRLIDDPTGFLSTVQVGITLVGIFAGAYGGSVLAAPLAAVLADWPLIGPYAQTVAFVAVVVAITYLSLVLGELVPKRFALRRAEAIAAMVAPFMSLLSRIGAPLVWLLRVSTEAVASLLGSSADEGNAVTEDDVRAMIAEGTRSGVFEPKERQMLEGVIRIADRTVRSIMVPRPDVVWLHLADPADMVLAEIAAAGHSRFPVVDSESDDVVGIVQTKDLLEQQRQDGRIDLRAAMREALYVHETMPILKLLERFRTTRIHLAVVLDEYGSLEGIATPTDILVAIAGALPESLDGEPGMVQRPDGSWLVDATMSVDAVAAALPDLGLPEARDYETVAGFALDRFGAIPEVGERFAWNGWTVEVVDLDGRRIDKLLLSPPPAETLESSGA
jgi:putative hemolysin